MSNEIKTFEEAELKIAIANGTFDILTIPNLNKAQVRQCFIEAATLWQQSNIDRIKELEEIIINDTTSLVSYQLRIKELEEGLKKLISDYDLKDTGSDGEYQLRISFDKAKELLNNKP